MVTIHRVEGADSARLNVLVQECDEQVYGAAETWSDEQRACLLVPSEASTTLFLVAEREGQWVGYASVQMSHTANTDQALVYVQVLKPARGRGIGGALVQAALTAAREAGRTKVLSYGFIPAHANYDDVSLPLHRLAARYGLKPVQNTGARGRVLPLEAEEQLTAAQAQLPGYTFELWVPGIPQKHYEAMCDVRYRMKRAVPKDNMAYEVRRQSVEEFAQQQERLATLGFSSLYAVARGETGEVVAYSYLAYKNTPGTSMAVQEDTFVDSCHRGQGLGLMLKRVTHTELLYHQPAIKRVITWNAVANEAIQRVNEQMGYTLLFKEIYFQGSIS